MGFIFSKAKESEDRLRKVLIADKHFNPENLKRVISSDIFQLLNNYGEIRPENLEFDIEITDNGDYIFNITAKCNRLKVFGCLPD